MRARPVPRTTDLLVWFGLLAAPAAWTVQLVVGSEVEETACAAGGRQFSIDTSAWHLALTAGPAALALAGTAVAGLAALAVRRGRGDARGRVEFLAIAGVLGSFLFLVLILLGGIAALALHQCNQG